MSINNKNIDWNTCAKIGHINRRFSFDIKIKIYKKIERVRVKHASCRLVTSRSLIVGTRGFCSGAIALPNTDKLDR